jgi:hypothetical protein
MGIKSVLSKIFASRPARPAAPETRRRAITPRPMTVSLDGVQSVEPLPADPFPEPFLVDSVSLGQILDYVRAVGEIDRKYVFDIKKGTLVLDGEKTRIHPRIANAVWPEGYRRIDLSGGRLKFEYAEGVFTVRIFDLSTSFHRMYEALINDRRTIKAHLQNLLAGINCEFADLDGDFERGVVFTIKIS